MASQTAQVQKDAQNSTKHGSFADLGIENTDIKTAVGVNLSSDQKVIVGSVLDVSSPCLLYIGSVLIRCLVIRWSTKFEEIAAVECMPPYSMFVLGRVELTWNRITQNSKILSPTPKAVNNTKRNGMVFKPRFLRS